MPKKKFAMKSAPKKATQAKSAKSAKQPKATPVNYLASVHELTQCIEKDYSQLKKLLETIPAKIEKSLTMAKSKLKKAKDAEAKSKKSFAETQKKKKIGVLRSKELANYEKTLAEQDAATSTLEDELKNLSDQLQTSKKMRDEYKLLEKTVQKIRTDFKKPAAKKPKKLSRKAKSKLTEKAESKTPESVPQNNEENVRVE